MGIMQKIGGYILILVFTFLNAAFVGLCGSVLGLFFLIGPLAFLPLGLILFVIADIESFLLSKCFPKTSLKFFLLGYVLPFVALIGICALVTVLFPDLISGLFGGSTPPNDPSVEYIPIETAFLIFLLAVSACILTTLTALALNCRKCPNCKKIGINFMKLTDETKKSEREEFTGNYNSTRVATLSTTSGNIDVYQDTPEYRKYETREKTYICTFCKTEVKRAKEYHIGLTRKLIDSIKKEIEGKKK